MQHQQKENGGISTTDAGLQEKTDADLHEKKWYPVCSILCKVQI